MLTAAQAEARAESRTARRARPLLSPRQRYHEYLMQRIEDYKNSLSREQMLRLGDDATSFLHDASEEQYSLTEVVMQETVDQLIKKRLRLPTFARWRQKHAKLRQAQQAPTHWGLERYSALTSLLARMEPGDHALVVGGGAEAACYLLAAHDLQVTLLVGDGPTCTRIETRMAAESLTGQFEALVVVLGSWFPTLPDEIHCVVVDAGTLQALPLGQRVALMAHLQARTVPGGLHAVVPGEGGGPPESWASLYPEWDRVPLPARAQRRAAKREATSGILLARPLPIPTVRSSSA